MNIDLLLLSFFPKVFKCIPAIKKCGYFHAIFKRRFLGVILKDTKITGKKVNFKEKEALKTFLKDIIPFKKLLRGLDFDSSAC